MVDAQASRRASLRGGVRLEIFTVAWMTVEAAVALGAGFAARSVLVTAFGFDSLIELASGAVLLWRLEVERRGGHTDRVDYAEAKATLISAVLLGLLCAYLVFVGAAGILTRSRPDASALGAGVALAAVIIMPALGWRKRRANEILKSSALRADIAETATCAYMAAATLAGTTLNLIFGLWWAEYLAAAGLLYFVARETWEAVEAVRGVSDSDDD